ncbi:MAG: cation-transporting P-type ATPase [bacterium]|nr:cation-transporting P-type ATPase [bacterium]
MPRHLPDLADPCGSIHTAPVEEVYRSLATGPGGLSPDEAESRLYRFGPNAIREVRRAPLVLKFLANFTHLMAVLLWVGGTAGRRTFLRCASAFVNDRSKAICGVAVSFTFLVIPFTLNV